jgi:GPH family glycoside/pentoside/hexuronide:cation symporter
MVFMSNGTKNDSMDGNSPREIRFSSKTHASYALGSFFDDFLSTAFSVQVFFFYEKEIFLPTAFVAIAFVLYGIWNMFNDPLVGYISEIPTRFTKRWGKRFPWFMLTAIPCAVIFTFIFSPPLSLDSLGTFFYLLIFICLFDFFFSFWNTNWMATFPVKFRSHRERTKVAAFQTPLSQVGLALGMLLPPLFFTYNNPRSYILQGLVVSLICVGVVLLMIPSMREDPATRELSLKVQVVQESRPPYFQTLKKALKEKNFIAYLMAYLGQTVMMVVVLASVPYLVTDILHLTDPDAETYISAMVLIGGLIMVPVWIKVARKFGNRVGYMCGTGLTAMVLITFLFVADLTQAMVCGFLVGMTMSATWTLLYPTFSDVIDEIVVKAGKRNEGIYYGFRTFFGRLSIVIQAVAFWVIHTLTGYVQDALTQTDLALWGIRIQMAVIPMIFYLIGFVFMWRVYDLKPLKVQDIKKQLETLGL